MLRKSRVSHAAVIHGFDPYRPISDLFARREKLKVLRIRPRFVAVL
jgi:hypothetical protein